MLHVVQPSGMRLARSPSCHLVLQDLLGQYFGALHEKHLRSLRFESIQECLQHLTHAAEEEPAQGDSILSLLRDNLTDMRPHEAQVLIQVLLDVFRAGVVDALKLLPNLLSQAAATGETFSCMHLVVCAGEKDQPWRSRHHDLCAACSR